MASIKIEDATHMMTVITVDHAATSVPFHFTSETDAYAFFESIANYHDDFSRDTIARVSLYAMDDLTMPTYSRLIGLDY